jgi:hypothetical protein
VAAGIKPPMARKKQNFERQRAEFVADPALIEAATDAGESLGLGLSAFIRVAITEKINRMKAEGYVPPKKPKK